MSDPELYTEYVSSKWTSILFIALALLFGGLAIWSFTSSQSTFLKILTTVLAFLFWFYVINYRTLRIILTPQVLNLKFGVFACKIPLQNIQNCQVDDPPWYYKYGGAGIHFYYFGGRYRASFNFLEYPRVVVELRKKVFIVRDISFTTRQPEKVIRLVKDNLPEYH